ncbi:unnamed protein product [Pedinophyceae sp. YPF-701]|nr:unnamed protein product [Pedinophyceae sp. YPF-701]
MQLFVSYPGGDGRMALEVAHEATVGDLRAVLEARTGIPAHEQLLSASGKPCGSNATHLWSLNLRHGSSMDLLLSLAGGKGGFGALLRAGGKVNHNDIDKSACRDLQGRRVRQVEAAKELEAWEASKKEREEQLRVAREERKLQKRLEKEREADQAKERMANLFDVVEGKPRAAVAKGLQAASAMAQAEARKRAAKPAQQRRAQKRMRLIGLDDSDVSVSSTDSDSDSDGGAGPSEPRTPSGSAPLAPAPAPASGGGSEPDAASPQEERSADAAGAGGDAGSDDPVDLSQYDSAQELEGLGLERLKRELSSRGLKCGGTLQQRAERLFLLKGRSIEEVDKKHRAGK